MGEVTPTGQEDRQVLIEVRRGGEAGDGESPYLMVSLFYEHLVSNKQGKEWHNGFESRRGRNSWY